jgi:hypothetical protein
MTPPKSVDISPLYQTNLNYQNFDKKADEPEKNLSSAELTQMLLDTDFKVDPETGKVYADEATQEKIDLFKQYALVRVLIDTAGPDQKLDLKEAGLALEKLGMRGASPEVFLQHTQSLIDKRWGKISKNLQKLNARRPLNSLVKSLESYNHSLYEEEKRLAHRAFSPVKFGLNVASVASWITPDAIWQRSVDVVDPKHEKTEASAFWGDDLAQDQAVENYFERQKAIKALSVVIRQGLDNPDTKSWAWNAMPSDPNAAKTGAEQVLSQLEQAGEIDVTVNDTPYKIDGKKAADLLRDHLAFGGLYDIATTGDTNERFTKVIQFAENERAGFLGFGSGNTRQSDWAYNVFGGVNAHSFARASLAHVMRKGSPELRSQADAIRKDMNGEGGGYWQVISNSFISGGVRVYNLFGGNATPPTIFKDWSDEDSTLATERFVRGSLMFFGGWAGVRKAKTVIPNASEKLTEYGVKLREGLKTEGYWAGLTKAQKLGAATYLAGYQFRKWALLGFIRDPFRAWLQAKTVNPGMGAALADKAAKGESLFWQAATAGALIALIDKSIVPANPSKVKYDRNLDLRPIPLQDPTAMKWDDPMLNDYSKVTGIPIQKGDPRERKE